MRGAVCILLSFILLFTLSTVDVTEHTQLSAWWGLLFPQMFARPDGTESVTFTWPFFEMVFKTFRMNG